MKKSVLLSVFVAMLCVACSNSNETPSGLKYTVVRKGDGVKAKTGEILVMNFILKDGKDSVLSDSEKNPFPTMLQAMDSVPKGDVVTEVIQLLSKGDSVTFKVSSTQLFQGGQFPPGIDSTSMFNFFVGINDIVTEERAREIQSEIVAKQNETAMLEASLQLAKDTTAIADFLKAKSMVAKKTASGLSYVITKPGKGETPKAGQSVKVNYAGYLLGGACFDSSIESVARANNVFNEQRTPYSPLDVTLGYQQVIPGWEEALGLMNKGSKMTVYIPSSLGYGAQGNGPKIPGNSILMFEMEMMDIK